MNRFSKYELVFYRGDKGARMIEKEGYIVRFVLTGRIIENIPNEYLVQTHKRFLGIGYWRTLVKTTSYKIARDAYDLMVYDGKIGF